jgi:hypothetical protein
VAHVYGHVVVCVEENLPGAGPQCLLRIDNYGQRLVLDIDGFQGIFS